ncbi:MAG: YqjF family protein [Verrucomicrobiales bacterium]
MSPSIEQRLAARQRDVGQPVMYQAWRQLLFLHWRVDVESLQARLPDGLTVDLFEGEAYVGIVPFFMCGVRPRFLPGFPGLSNFLEVNVRTYVHDADGVPGVWFFSLDANCSPAVWVARTFFKLPYRHAVMSAQVSEVEAWVDYHSRCEEGEYDTGFRYRGKGAAREAEAGCLEFFLLERYYLFAHDPVRGRMLRGQVAHSPYRFREAEVDAFDAGPMLGQGIIPLGSERDRGYHHACVADDVEVKIYGLEVV